MAGTALAGPVSVHARGSDALPSVTVFETLSELADEYRRVRELEEKQDPDPSAGIARAQWEGRLAQFQTQMIDAQCGAEYEWPRWMPWLLHLVWRRRKPSERQIKEYFFCTSLPAGAVLFSEPDSRMYLAFAPDGRAPAWIAALLVRAEILYSEIREVLRGANRAMCLDMVFAGIVQLLKLMGDEDHRQRQACASVGTHLHLPWSRAENGNGSVNPRHHQNQQPLHVPQEWNMPPWPDLQKMYEAQFEEGAELVRRMAQRQAQLDYFNGMVVGGVLLAALVVALSWWSSGPGNNWIAVQLQFPSGLTPLLWLTPIIGGVGAVVSVMQRMGSGSLVLRDRVGAWALSRVGAFRPLIGAVFACVIVTILMTGLVPMQMKQDQPNLILLYCAISFFAGFSERFAQDMLGAGEMAVEGATAAEKRAAAT